jgi:CHASE2 domain-containing sensor protein
VRHRLANEPIPDRRDSATYVLKRRMRALVGAHRISTWLMVTVGAVLMAQAVGWVLDAWTPLHLCFERTITSRMQPAGTDPLTKVRMVEMRDGTNWVALARSLGLNEVNPAQRVTLRRLHNELMKRLARSGARVVVFDIFFARSTENADCPYENELLDGIAGLRRNNVEVVFTAGGGWDIGEDDLAASMCPGLARETKWGFVTVNAGDDAPWSLELLVQPNNRHPMPSLALAACAAYWRPARFHWVNFDVDQKLARCARISYSRPGVPRPRAWGAPAEGYVDEVPLSERFIVEKSEPDFGRSVGDWIGYYIFHIPSDKRIRAATIDYAEVFGASEAKLREWFDGRVVVIGDARADGHDGPFPTPDGRSYCGFVVHALGINSILASNGILAPFRVSLPVGVNVRSDALYAAACTVAGALLGLWVPQPPWRRRAITALLLLAIIGASVLFYWQGRVLHGPIVPMLGAVFAVEGIGWLGSVGRRGPGIRSLEALSRA